MSREYLADEITMIQSDNQVLKQENDLYRMTSERKAEENRILKEDLNDLRALYADKVDEAAALRTILEGIGHNVSAGLTRFMQRRELKQQRTEERREPEVARTAVVQAYREEQGGGHEAYAPPPRTAAPRQPEPAVAMAEPAPRFLRNTPRVAGADHALLPPGAGIMRSDEDINADMRRLTQ